MFLYKMVLVMKWFIRILSVFCVSLSGAMAMDIQDLEEDRKKSAETLQIVCKHIGSLKKEDYEAYFGKTKRVLLEKIQETYYNIQNNSQIIFSKDWSKELKSEESNKAKGRAEESEPFLTVETSLYEASLRNTCRRYWTTSFHKLL